ncbi:DoxX family membrane protein [Candidatus Woesearchaeota archaeon]|nr:DoxX family membrane protein [Candidatus Woesearchaeota archaeon]
MKDKNLIALLFLRVVMALIFLYFGILAIIDPGEQIYWLSNWIMSIPLVGTVGFIVFIGILETLAGIMLLLGLLIRPAAILASLLLLGVIVNLGWSEIMLRDVGLMAATLVLVFTPEHMWAIRARLK